MNEGLTTLATIIGGILTVAIIAVIVSNNANTSGVLTGGGKALAGVISAAVAPVTQAQSNTFGGAVP